MFTVRALREAAVPILVLLAVSLALLVLWLSGMTWSLFALGFSLLLLGATLCFFRDPSRVRPGDAREILAPADGTVVGIDSGPQNEFLAGNTRMVAIFLSVFDVHVQRSPIHGRIALVRYKPGGHLDARRRESGLRNESRLVGLEAEDGFRVVVRQIAGLVARRIVGWAGEGAWLDQGERMGMIRFGSRVELVLPAEAEILVRLGQHVRGGETVLARRP